MLTDFYKINKYPDLFLEYQFRRVFNILSRKIGCTYASYIMENRTTGQKVKFCSRPEWDDFYYDSNRIASCHLAEIVRKMQNKSFTMRWSDIKPDSSHARLVNGARIEFNLGHGITFVTWIPTIIGANFELINLTGDVVDKSFPKEVLLNKAIVSKMFLILRSRVLMLLSNLPDADSSEKQAK